MSPAPLRRPSDLGEDLPTIEFHEWTDPVYRIQDEGQISSRTYPKPRYRFDAPHGEYAVLYANDTGLGTPKSAATFVLRPLAQITGTVTPMLRTVSSQ